MLLLLAKTNVPLAADGIGVGLGVPVGFGVGVGEAGFAATGVGAAAVEDVLLIPPHPASTVMTNSPENRKFKAKTKYFILVYAPPGER